MVEKGTATAEMAMAVADVGAKYITEKTSDSTSQFKAGNRVEI